MRETDCDVGDSEKALGNLRMTWHMPTRWMVGADGVSVGSLSGMNLFRSFDSNMGPFPGNRGNIIRHVVGVF